MINFTQVTKTLREIVSTRTGISLDKVIRAKNTGAKPKGLFAAVDILRVSDAASWVTNKFYDAVAEEMVYQTYSDVVYQLSVRNGNPRDDAAQDAVLPLCNSLHKAFVEEAVLGYLEEFGEASVKTVEPLRVSSDFLPTGYGEVVLFNITVTVVDETREAQTPIESVDVDSTLYTGSGEVVGDQDGVITNLVTYNGVNSYITYNGGLVIHSGV